MFFGYTHSSSPLRVTTTDVIPSEDEDKINFRKKPIQNYETSEPNLKGYSYQPAKVVRRAGGYN